MDIEVSRLAIVCPFSSPSSGTVLSANFRFFQSASSDIMSDRHLFLSCAISHTSPLSTPIFSKSLSMFFIHVNLRAPLAILSGFSHSSINILIGVSSDNLMRCP